MRKKGLWLLVSAVIILAMLLTACKTEETTTATTTAATTTATTTTATTTAITTATTTTATTAGMPKYGGTLNVSLGAELTSYDTWSTNPHPFARMIYDAMMQGSIETTEEEWPCYGMYYPQKYLVGVLLESWEEIGTDTVIFHLRQGIHFQNVPPVNGREMTSDDVVYSFNRCRSTQGQIATAQNILLFAKSLTALDTYTLEYKYYPDQVTEGWTGTWYKANTWVVAREVVEKYNNSLANPIGQVGTGPYIIKDYVPGSSFTCVRNPDYWGTDPRYPGNKLPYIDTVVTTVIPDLSTRIAALRTGKLARLGTIPVNQYQSLAQTSPQLLYRRILSESSTQMSLRNDVPPFMNNIKVRQALSMAIDRHAIVDQYLQGMGQYSNCRVPMHWPEYIPLEQFPQDIQDIYNYDPVKAKQLMTEAGYPNGFKTEVILPSTSTDGIEICQLIKSWWKEALNVDLDIKVMEAASAQSIQLRHVYPQIYYSGAGISYPAFAFSFFYQPGPTFGTYNTGNVRDAVYNEKYYAFTSAWNKTQAEKDALWYDLVLYMRQQVFSIDVPTTDTFLFWQPWLKGHWGQAALTFTSAGDFYKYMWIDKD